MRSKYGYEPPLPLNFSLSDTHTNVQVLAAADTDSGTEIVSLWLEFGTTVSLIRVEGGPHGWVPGWCKTWLRGRVLERPTNNHKKYIYLHQCAHISSPNVFIAIVAARSFVCRKLPQISFGLKPTVCSTGLLIILQIKFPCSVELKASYITAYVTLHYLWCLVAFCCMWGAYLGEKQNAFSQSSFYFLHQHFKTG